MRFSKKLLAVVLVFMMVFALMPVMAFASDTITVTIDGQAVDFEDQEPIMVDGRVLVPVRFVFLDLGFEVDWNRSTRTATLERDDFTVVIVIGETRFTINGASHALDVPAQLIGGRTMVPLGPILRGVGYELDWVRSKRTVVIETPAPDTDLSIFDPLTESALSLLSISTLLSLIDADENLDAIYAAAEAGVAMAQFILGVMYDARSALLTFDFDRVYELLHLAAEQDHARAMVVLAFIYLDDLMDEEEAYSWFLRAAELGNAMGQAEVATSYRLGEGVAQNYERATYWYRHAAEQGIPRAQNNLGARYESGVGVAQCYEQAVFWYRVAAKGGISRSYYNLGRMYMNGTGVDQCDDEAIYWFSRAYASGLTWVMEYIIELGVSSISLHLGVGYTILPKVHEFNFYELGIIGDDGMYLIASWQFLELHDEINLADFPAADFTLEYDYLGLERGDVILYTGWDGTMLLVIGLGDGQIYIYFL